MICQNLDFYRTCEEEQGMNLVLELINLTNLNDKSEPTRSLA